MTMAFAAALTGGVALETESLNQEDQNEESAKQLKAGIRLFDLLDFGGGTRKSRKESVHLESRVVRRHTEASIFINLMEELRRRDSIAEPDLKALKPGQIVSIEVGPATAPLLRVVNQILRLLEITNPEPTEQLNVAKSRPPSGQRPKANNARTATAPGPAEASSNPVDDARKLFRSLKGDLEFSGMTDMVVKREEDFSVLLTLDNRFITPQTLELLQTSTSRVIGKVTRIWSSETDFINLYRRSVLSLVPALPGAMGLMVLGLLGGLAKAIDVQEIQRQTNATLGLEAPEETEQTEIMIGDDFQAMLPGMNGPAIQILPLAICA